MGMVIDVTVINLVAAAIMMLYTSYLDLKTREVPDKVWLGFGLVGGILQAYELWIGESAWVPLVLAVVLATIIGMGLFFFGFYGGADGKALIALALLVPYFKPAIGIYSIAPLMVLTNGVLISILLPFAMLVLNCVRLVRGMKIFVGFEESLPRKLLACFLGYKQTGKPRPFQFSMEKAELRASPELSDPQMVGETKKFDFSMMRDDFETQSGTWVTPGIPLLVFFTGGFFVLLVYGDLVIGIIQTIFRFAGL